MGKILIFIAAAIIAWLLFKGLIKKSNGAGRDKSENVAEKMVKCELCGVFMPASESVQLDDKVTCSTPSKCLRRQSA